MKKIFSILFMVLFVFTAATLAVSAARIDIDDKGIYYSNLLDFNKETNAYWANYDEAAGKWVPIEIDDYSQPCHADGKICSPILSNQYMSHNAREWSLIEDGEVLRVQSTDASIYPGLTFILDAAHSDEFPVGRENSNPAKAEYVKIRVKNFSNCDQITFGFATNSTNGGRFLPATLSELTFDANGKVYESGSGEWQTYTFSIYELNKNTNYDELLYDPEDENSVQLSRWSGNLYEFLIFPFGYNVTDGTGNYPGATMDIDYVVIGSKDYVTHYRSALENKENNIVSLELIKVPDKTKYVVGEALDLTGLELKATFGDGSTEILTSASASVGTFDKVEHSVELKYGNQSVSFSVEVVDISSIEMISLPSASKGFDIADLNEYGFGAYADENNVRVKVNYADGTSNSNLANAHFSFVGNFTDAGEATVNVYYYGKYTSFEINLIKVTDIEIIPTKTYQYGQFPKIYDFDINFIYSDGSKISADNTYLYPTYNEEELKQYIAKGPGKMNIEIKAFIEEYNLNITKTVEIEVETPVRVEVTFPKKTDYMQGETLDTTGLKIQLVYVKNNGNETKLTVSSEDYFCQASTETLGRNIPVPIISEIPGLKELFEISNARFTINVTENPAYTTESTPPPEETTASTPPPQGSVETTGSSDTETESITQTNPEGTNSNENSSNASDSMETTSSESANTSSQNKDDSKGFDPLSIVIIAAVIFAFAGIVAALIVVIKRKD
ncbi:MAG: bacterial Ig-like domain-containing protein [Clostridia bacterium]|nr:bacterial Ig-like domain-containing protein [Clostridia bacterium]